MPSWMARSEIRPVLFLFLCPDYTYSIAAWKPQTYTVAAELHFEKLPAASGMLMVQGKHLGKHKCALGNRVGPIGALHTVPR